MDHEELDKMINELEMLIDIGVQLAALAMEVLAQPNVPHMRISQGKGQSGYSLAPFTVVNVGAPTNGFTPTAE